MFTISAVISDASCTMHYDSPIRAEARRNHFAARNVHENPRRMLIMELTFEKNTGGQFTGKLIQMIDNGGNTKSPENIRWYRVPK